jgi:hypothetical protein
MLYLFFFWCRKHEKCETVNRYRLFDEWLFHEPVMSAVRLFCCLVVLMAFCESHVESWYMIFEEVIALGLVLSLSM